MDCNDVIKCFDKKVEKHEVILDVIWDSSGVIDYLVQFMLCYQFPFDIAKLEILLKNK